MSSPTTDENKCIREHYWKSMWNNDGQFICKTCGKVPKDCNGSVRILS